MMKKETCIQEHTRIAVKWAGKDPKSPVGHSHEGRITSVRVILAEVVEGLQVINGIEMNAGLYHPVLQTLSKILPEYNRSTHQPRYRWDPRVQPSNLCFYESP